MPIAFEGVIARLSDGDYDLRDQDMHLRMGPTAVIITDPMCYFP